MKMSVENDGVYTLYEEKVRKCKNDEGVRE